MANITDQAPQRIPEWLSLQDIATAWSEETGEDAAAFEAGFRGWFKDYLLRNAYGEEGAGGEDDAGIPVKLLEGRQIWRCRHCWPAESNSSWLPTNFRRSGLGWRNYSGPVP